MLPDIVSQNGKLSAAHGIVLVSSRSDFEFSSLGPNQPRPAAAKLAQSRLLKRLFELVEAGKCLVDGVGDGACGIPTLVRAHDLPEHGVVHVAAGIVAHSGPNVLRHGAQVADQIFCTLLLETSMLFHRGITVRDVIYLLFVMMER